MNKYVKMLIVSAILLLAGFLVCGISFAALGFDPLKLRTTNYTLFSEEIGDSFKDIMIRGDAESITIKTSEDKTCSVDCFADGKDKYSIRVEDGTLIVERTSSQLWFEFAGVLMERPSITVSLPAGTYGNVTAETDHGGIRVAGLKAGELTLKTDNGRIDLSETTASGSCDLKTDNGGIRFSGLDAETINIRTEHGDVEGTILTDKIFTAKSEMGTVRVPDTSSGGPCVVRTEAGDINIAIR